MKRNKKEECEESQVTTIYTVRFKLYFALKQSLKKMFIPSNFIFSFDALQAI